VFLPWICQQVFFHSSHPMLLYTMLGHSDKHHFLQVEQHQQHQPLRIFPTRHHQLLQVHQQQHQPRLRQQCMALLLVQQQHQPAQTP